ncbi:hypothetical protein SeLEV6574_g08204 [Synchytrium endobioticum]|uniref:ILEI/PANDER domain-containing protein n=1 Tax=Synchytrium endobioticum TaxID=286115 RepID=A0A507CCC4_9FUNG|nr:hypothetical protein SeLEV6574_g08204 [Synchytrium endobioticum]
MDVSTSKCCGMKKYIVKVDFDSSSNVVLQYLIHESGKTHRRNRCRSLFLQSLQGSPHAFFNAFGRKPCRGLAGVKIAQASQTDPEASLARSANLPLPNTLFLGIQSAGLSAGNFCRIEICRDGQLIPLPGVVGRGLNVVILDPFDGAIVEFASFDVHTSTEDSENLGKLLQFLEPGMIFVMGCKDDCAERLTPETRLVIEAVGSAYIKEVKYRDSWAIIGEKGQLIL